MSTMREIILNAVKNASYNKPVTRSDLMSITGLSDRRNRELIHILREEGNFIAFGAWGYYMATTASEKECLLLDLKSKANSLNKVVAALEASNE